MMYTEEGENEFTRIRVLLLLFFVVAAFYGYQLYQQHVHDEKIELHKNVILVVPEEDMVLGDGELTGNGVRFMGGILEETTKENTTIKTYEGHKIILEEGTLGYGTGVGEPVWVTVMIRKDKIEDLKIAPLESGDIEEMQRIIGT